MKGFEICQSIRADRYFVRCFENRSVSSLWVIYRQSEKDS